MFNRGFKSWCENVAIQQRRLLKLRAFDALDPRLLAKHLGVDVWTPHKVPNLKKDCLKTLLSEDPDSWSAVTIHVSSKHLIILNSAHSAGRRASDLMHELSHLLIGHQPARVDVSDDGLLMLSTYDRKQEEEAHWLAGCLLLPRDALLVIGREETDLRTAARKYGVSVPMLRYRLNVTGTGNALGGQKEGESAAPGRTARESVK